MTSGDELRALMRRFPSGVCVVTVDDDGVQVGITVGSLVSLSLDPPLVGISVGRDGSLHEPLRRAGAFAVSLLGEEQVGLAQHFARSGVPPVVQWSSVRSRPSSSGAPLLDDAVGWLECRTWAEYDAGDHTFFVAEVLSVEDGPAGAPLVYLEREYRPL